MYFERDSMPYCSRFLCNILTLGSSNLNCESIHRKYEFSINLEISFMSSGDHPILTLGILVANFCRFRYFADFDIKFLLLG